MSAKIVRRVAAALIVLVMVTALWADEDIPEFSFRYGEVGNGQQITPDGKLGLRPREYPSEVNGLRDLRLELFDLNTRQATGLVFTGGCNEGFYGGKNLPPNCWAFSPDGRWLAIGSSIHQRKQQSAGHVGVWNVKTAKMVTHCTDPLGKVKRVQFDPDSRTIRILADEPYDQTGR